jgi:hypothetical protein
MIGSIGLAVLAVSGWFVLAMAFVGSLLKGGNLHANWTQALARAIEPSRPNGPASLSVTQSATLLAIGLIALPIEFLFVSISGNPFDHYFLTLLPVMALLAAFTFRLLLNTVERLLPASWAAAAFTIALLVVLTGFAGDPVRAIWARIHSRGNDQVLSFIRQHTAPEDFILLWGGESRVNFAAQRASPSRYINLRHLYPRDGVRAPERASTFLEELLRNPPRYIFYTGSPTTPYLEFPYTAHKIKRRVQKLRAMYRESQVLNGWTVYERVAE